MPGPVVILAGGTGGAKLARGMLDVAGADLVVVANTGDDVEAHGASAARPTPEVLAAIAGARAVVVGPSNPVISIGPILALPGLREALHDTTAPVVAVSPLVRGRVLKGPTDAFMAWAGLPLS